MSDLCYNCSTCHLQAGPCQRDLVQCEICYSWGHQYIFCPRGVGLRDDTYRYWALCHNCDRWHLPHPCDKSLHPCGQCGNTGHMEFFCPVRPIGRMAYIQQQYLLTANGPQPTNHGYRLPLDGAIPHETITRIKIDAVRQAFTMLDNDVQPIDVLAFMAGPPLANPSPMSGATGPTIEQHPNVGHPGFQQTPWAPIPPNLPVQPAAHQMTQHVKTEPEHGRASTYASMHQRFDQGALAQSIEQERPMDTTPMMGHPSMAQGMLASHEVVTTAPPTTSTMQHSIMTTQDTEPGRQRDNLALEDSNLEQDITPTIETAEDTINPEKTEKPKKVAKTDREGTPGGSLVKQGRRCAACVKSHKKCAHRAQVSPTPQPAVATSFGTPSAAASPPFEGPTPTVSDDSFALPNAHNAMPTPTSAPKKAAAVKRKR